MFQDINGEKFQVMLDIPIGTVTWKNNEALKKLKQYLEREDIK